VCAKLSMHAPGEEKTMHEGAHDGTNGAAPHMPRRILVIANRTCPCPRLLEEIRDRALGGPNQVLIVAPALNTRLRFLTDDTDRAVLDAEARLTTAVESLRAAGVHAQGAVGDAEPVQAIEDALHSFAADELIVSTHPPGDSHWLERGLLERARERFDLPVVHLDSRYGVEALT